MKKLSVLLLCVLFTSCVPTMDDDDLWPFSILYNQSTNDIYYDFSKRNNLVIEYAPNENFFIEANGRATNRFNKEPYHTDETIISFWFFDAEVIETVPWEEIKANDMYLEHRVLTIGELKEANWEIVFTGE